MPRRYVRLRKVEPDLHLVESVLELEDPPQDGTVVAAPPGFTVDQLLRSAVVGERWVNAERVSKTSISKRGPIKTVSKNEVLWNGYVYALSGYAKANREIIFRLQDRGVKVGLVTGDYLPEKAEHPEPHIRNRLLMAEAVVVSDAAPLVRFFLPRREEEERFRTLWFMTETARMHPNLVNRIEAFYDELWVPTEWNRESFRESGGRIPCHVMPLGVDETIYLPPAKGMKPRFPLCERISPSPATGHPDGFVFLYVFQPVFRKGAEFLASVFNDLFPNRDDVHLVLATTTYPTDGFLRQIKQSVGKANVWILQKSLTEGRMAELYQAADAYVTASMGEGWNLPLCEAAATGLPVIAPRHTAHLQYLDPSNSYTYECDGEAPVEQAQGVCSWYDGMPFAVLGDKARGGLAAAMMEVFFHYDEALLRARRLRSLMLSCYTWDMASENVIRRLTEIAT